MLVKNPNLAIAGDDGLELPLAGFAWRTRIVAELDNGNIGLWREVGACRYL